MQRLVEQAKQGNLDAFDQLVGEFQGVAFRAAFFTLGDAQAAEDAVQEAFVKAYLNLGSFDLNRPFRPWLLRIVTNEALNSHRTSRRQADLQLRTGQQSIGNDNALLPEDIAIAGDTRQQLIDALNQLSSRDRGLIAYRYFLELEPSEIADIWEQPPSTIRTQLSRALIRLRTIFTNTSDQQSHTPLSLDGES